MKNGNDFPCDYLPGKNATLELKFEDKNKMNPSEFQSLIESGFEHLATIMYKPVCPDCKECKPIRIPVQDFTPDRSMRRTLKINQDLKMKIGEPSISEAKKMLYQLYNETRHPEADCMPLELVHFSPVTMMETSFYLGRRLVCVTLSDIIPNGLNMVYTYFDPELEKRSLGTNSILWVVDRCKQENEKYCYLGYYVKGCRKAEYKKRFIPHEILESDGIWH